MLVSYDTTVEMNKFPCKSQSYQTFEITCSLPNCNVDIMGIDEECSGLYLQQYQTL
ncbi:hypothetical protein CPB84DRAFT_1852940 [Gymnopilus junonius]|uniref:Uncharacterized protein n=1 Tax=Gymnopilus junonius TaxID=109634 RepID=A0A9P5NA62_GYMJU|nr:hypothetical protein CPB84DRAFT_1852940 [Gymnopilus junonius]